jgi:hypothetical protein
MNWAPLTDSQANININDLTLAPNAPDTILAATNGGLRPDQPLSGWREYEEHDPLSQY